MSSDHVGSLVKIESARFYNIDTSNDRIRKKFKIYKLTSAWVLKE